MKEMKEMSQYNRIAILRGYRSATSAWHSSRFGTMLELKTSKTTSTYVRLSDVRSIDPNQWDSDRIFGQRFAVVTLTDGEVIKTGATVGEINQALREI